MFDCRNQTEADPNPPPDAKRTLRYGRLKSGRRSTNQLGDVDIHTAFLCDRLNRASKIQIAHKVLIGYTANGRPGGLRYVDNQHDCVQSA